MRGTGTRGTGIVGALTAFACTVALVCAAVHALAGCGSSADTAKGTDASTAPSTAPSPNASASASDDASPSANERAGANMLFNGPDHWDGEVPNGCAAGKDVRIVIVRGTLERAEGSSLETLAQSIGERIGGRASIDVLDYPASWKSGSEARGVNMLIATLNAQARACPSTKTALLGYSQGAMVVGDALSAPEARFNDDNGQSLSAQALANIAVVELFGDPRFDASADYGAGSYDRSVDGILGARDGDDLRALQGRIVSYCNADDFACQLGGHDDAHGLYRSNGTFDEAVTFAVPRTEAALK
ncbi:cutinase family protein [Bifidobacterium criceti]|uniref:Cutinase n=1 Tax=Bifidobacterium criceti TaxID=1960969 RepID=A0A2A2EGJ0_9BIFI|nr:cutinase family protein [Bifidobacterium criceti]PAU68364.1 cutinase [Bifidobacterium criceti]